MFQEIYTLTRSSSPASNQTVVELNYTRSLPEQRIQIQGGDWDDILLDQLVLWAATNLNSLSGHPKFGELEQAVQKAAGLRDRQA